MDFSWSEEQLAAKAEIIAFAQTSLNQKVAFEKGDYEFPRELWLKCAAHGIQGMAAGAEYGGSDRDFLTSLLMMEGLGYGCEDGGLTLGLNAQMWTVQTPIRHFGSDHLKAKFLPKFASGEITGAHALTEPEAGSDVYSLQTSAEKVDGGYMLNGQKCIITLAPIADMAIIFASTNPKLGKWGLTAFIVEKGMDGYLPGTRQMKMGLNSVPLGNIELKDCFVPDENILGKPGLGFSILNHSLEYDRCTILASTLGTMQRQLETSIAYVKSRKQFGAPIATQQSVANRIVEMKLRIETSRLLLYKTAWLMQQGKPCTLEAAMLKLHLSEAYVSSSIDAIRNHGGKGYLVENGIEKDLRDAMGGVIYAGTSDIQRNIIAKLIGL